MMYRVALTGLTLTCGLVVAYTTALAQPGAVSRDPATGDYLVQIRTLSSGTDVVRVPAVNGVLGAVQVATSSVSAGALRYDYSIHVLQSSPQSLRTVMFPCPAAEFRGEASATEFRSGVPSAVPLDVGVTRCSGLVFLPPGDSVHVAVKSALLPSVSRIGLVGSAEIPQWPCECWGDPANDPALAAIDTLAGNHGGWASVVSLAPVRAPEVVATPSATVMHLQSDLGLLCGPLGVLTDQGTYTSLSAKLEATAAAISRGNSNGAAGPLGAFTNELNAQRGKKVPELAFALLSFYGKRLSQQLGR